MPELNTPAHMVGGNRAFVGEPVELKRIVLAVAAPPTTLREPSIGA